MMPIEVCIYCSRKIDEKEKSVNLSTGVAHLMNLAECANDHV